MGKGGGAGAGVREDKFGWQLAQEEVRQVDSGSGKKGWKQKPARGWLWLEPRDAAGQGQSLGKQSHRLGVSLRGRLRAGSSQQEFGSRPGL